MVLKVISFILEVISFFDLEQQKILKLQDVILPQKMPQLEKLAYSAFKTWVKDSQLADHIEDYEAVWKFKMTPNFYLGQHGLILQYDEYEIGPYVVGLARLDLPYDQLNGILKPVYMPSHGNPSADLQQASAASPSTEKPKH